MKNYYKFIASATLLFYMAHFSFAQESFNTLSNHSSLIIEGKVIQQLPFIHDDGYVYTKSKIEVFKYFKHDQIKETIDIITLGGEIEDISQSWSHSIDLSENEVAIFFLTESNSFPETYIPYHGNQGILRYRSYDSDRLVMLSSNGNYENIEREVYDKIEKVTGSYTFIKLNPFEQKKLSNLSTTLRSFNCVEYSINNLEIIQNSSFSNSASFYLNFDIKIRALSENFLLHKTELAMTYSSALFGNYIVSNNKINTELGDDFNNYSISLSDVESNKVGIEIEVKENENTLEINTYKDKLYKASFLIENFDLEEILSLTVDENFDLTTYEETPTGVNEIECNKYDEDVNITLIQLLPPEITSYNQNVYAGTRTLLTIEGENLKNLNGSTEVWFYNANDGSIIEWVKPYNGDYISPVTSEKIEVYVPSYALNADSGINQNKEYAGSGKFKIVHKDFNGDITDESDEEDITVIYAVRNKYHEFGTGGGKTQPVMLKENSSPDGYIVTYTPEFSGLKDSNENLFKDAFARALNSWCTETGLNFKVDESAFSTGEYDLLIDYNTTNNPNALASTGITSIQDVNCEISIDNNSINHPVLQEVDLMEEMTIVFNSMWDINLWDAANLNAGILFSVERTALHELGHAHGILHTRNTTELMYSTPASNITTITPETKSASDYLQYHSSIQTCEPNYELSSECTTSTIELDEINSIQAWYTNNEIFIKTDEISFIEDINIYSINGNLLKTIQIDKNLYSIPFNANSGVYIISIKTPNGYYSEKFIIAD